MNDDLLAVEVAKKSGAEPFHQNGQPSPQSVLDFWRWSASDLLSNATRGVLAEYIVGLALDCVGNGTRREWDAADLLTRGHVRVEVKSAAYLQTWAQQRPSKIVFGINPTTGWDSASNTISEVRRRQSDVYVFAVLEHQAKSSVDPLNLDQWVFHVLSTTALNAAVPTQKTISLGRLLSLEPRTAAFAELNMAVIEASSAGWDSSS